MSQVEEKTPAWKIFHIYFKCYIPQYHLYSKEYVEQFGIPTSGDRDVDKNLAHSKVLSQLTIAQMANAVDEGVPVTLEDPRKSVEIYEILLAHLTKWRNAVSASAYDIKPPLEDLKKLDNLAGEVYKIARGYMKLAPRTPGLMEGLSKLGGRRPMGRSLQEEEVVKRHVDSEHKPVSDIISKEAFQRGSKWR